MNPRIPFAIVGIFAAAMLVRAEEPKPGLLEHEVSMIQAMKNLNGRVKSVEKTLVDLLEKRVIDQKEIARMRADNESIAKAVADLDESVKTLAAKHELDSDRMKGLQSDLTRYSARIAKLEAKESDARKASEPQPAKKAKEEAAPGPPTWTAFVEPLALEAAAAVKKKQEPNRLSRVAVFAFGDEKRKIGLELADSSRSLQACFIDRLTEAGKGSFSTLDQTDLKAAVLAAGKDLQSLSPSDPATVAERLKAMNIRAGILGTFYPNNEDGRNVGAMVVFDDGSFVHLCKEGPPWGSSGSDLAKSDRLDVQVLLRDGPNRWKVLPFVTSKKDGSEFGGVLFVEVPKGIKLGTPAAEFKIRIRNTGNPPLFKFDDLTGGVNPEDRRRLFAAAVRIDGVDSFYRRAGANEWKPKAVEESEARRWILTGPGDRLVQAKGAAGNAVLLPIKAGPDHSVIDIVGFQKGSDANAQADRFVFGPVNNSVAELVGVYSEVGLITVTFYAEKMKGDGQKEFSTTVKAMGPPNLGVMPGTTVANPAFEVVREWRPYPVGTWNIFYRQAGDVPIPETDRYLIPVAAPPVKNRK